MNGTATGAGSSIWGSLLALTLAAASICTVSGAEGLFGAMLGLIAIAIAHVDAREGLIPDQLSAAAAMLALVNTGLVRFDAGWLPTGEAAIRAAVAAGLLWLLRELYFRLRGRDGMGLGDVKLAAVAGFWLDWLTIALTIQTAAICAIAVHGGARLLRPRPHDAPEEIPFGVYLAPAIWLGWLYQAIVWTI